MREASTPNPAPPWTEIPVNAGASWPAAGVPVGRLYEVYVYIQTDGAATYIRDQGNRIKAYYYPLNLTTAQWFPITTALSSNRRLKRLLTRQTEAADRRCDPATGDVTGTIENEDLAICQAPHGWILSAGMSLNITPIAAWRVMWRDVTRVLSR